MLQSTRRYSRPDYFDGETFHLVSDLTGRHLQDLQPMMSHLGTKEAGRITNLRFPDIKKYRMKFVAIVESDGHVDINDGRLSYYEKNSARRRLAIKEFSEFGDFEIKEDQEDNKRVMLSRPFGRMAEKFGVPRGDKAIHNKGLYDTIVSESLNVKVLYPREMVPEDGSVSSGCVSVTRHNVVHAGNKAIRYLSEFGIAPKVTREHIGFIRDKGEERKEFLCYEKGDVVELKYEDLVDYKDHDDDKISSIAKDLDKTIKENPNKLLDDEITRIMEPIGVRMKAEIRSVLYYLDSGRVSIKATAWTSSINDTVRLLLIAPPNHPEKMKSALNIVMTRPKLVETIRKEIERDGLKIHESWERLII